MITIQIEKDGNAWCAHYGDFVNLQESEAEFGDTPDQAVIKLVKTTDAEAHDK